jgi:hypothetical protein
MGDNILSSAVTDKSVAISGIAGKYMFEDKPENVAAMATMVTINAFCRDVKML